MYQLIDHIVLEFFFIGFFLCFGARIQVHVQLKESLALLHADEFFQFFFPDTFLHDFNQPVFVWLPLVEKNYSEDLPKSPFRLGTINHFKWIDHQWIWNRMICWSFVMLPHCCCSVSFSWMVKLFSHFEADICRISLLNQYDCIGSMLH
jgi:hypothetical protein